ncbi:MAG: DUF6880 family protein [Paracoccaceae bacterium]
MGAEVLAELLMDAIKGDAARQRRVRMRALHHNDERGDCAMMLRQQ